MKNTILSICIVGCLVSCSLNSSDSKKNEANLQAKLDSIELAGNAQKLELEKEKLRLEQEKLKMEQDKLEKEKRAQVVNEAVRNAVFYDYQRVVVVNKTYFHKSPDAGTKGKAFLIPGDQFYIGRIKANYVYTDFTNQANGKTTSGWILMQDLAPLDH